jgi:2-keto-4-pentenoate hydratase/2-oxohepta-3-ene-1,7-dioic acid hydratase in catechol pathway
MSFEKHMKSLEAKTGKRIPDLWYERAIYFKGNPATVVGPEDAIVWPSYAEKLDYELEFGIYVGKEGKDIPVDEAHHYIGGYTIFNDVSARDVLLAEFPAQLGPAKGKDFDTGNVMGPCLVTPDELDVEHLRMAARVNGETWSEGDTSDMFWTFSQIIAHISAAETLYPGDFIGSGTVGGGCGVELDRWVQPGDVIELEIEGIGVLRNPVTREESECR